MSPIIGKIASVTETKDGDFFVRVETDPGPPPVVEAIDNPPTWSKALFRAAVGKQVEVSRDAAGAITVVKVSA